jgi:ectoine hydroxylase-related dioxygenase (phytanoyl-CoA dioxygenase family)
MYPALWIDQPGALDKIDSASVGDFEKTIARSLISTGLAVVRAAHDPEICEAVIRDYQKYSAENSDYVRGNLDSMGREKRLANFHHWSNAALQIGTNPSIMSALDFVFGLEAAVYTSLTFKYGTQQPVHRDTPHFATWPRGYFAGVWTALEPVSEYTGPLFYHPGAHRFRVTEEDFFDEARARLPLASKREQMLLALDLYNGEVIRTAPAIAEPIKLITDIGDTVIWHPEMPHGGSPATRQLATRWSIVFHAAPVPVQVHQHEAFFGHDKNVEPAARYSYAEAYNRKIAQAGGVGFM